MPFALPDLPYDRTALAPHISAETLDIHHGRHHKAYVTTVNTLLDTAGLKINSLEEVIAGSSRDESNRALFNAAAQSWNHTFYWASMAPGAGGAPSGRLVKQIEADFGSFKAFTDQFAAAAMGQFGSGWAWLVDEHGTLKVKRTPNAETPLTQGDTPLLAIDVWEHAYYVDYRNDRRGYVDTFLASLANWDFASRNLEQASGGKRLVLAGTTAA